MRTKLTILVPAILSLAVVTAAFTMNESQTSGTRAVLDEQAASITGGQCEQYSYVDNTGCGLWGAGLKFWEYCASVPFYHVISGVNYYDCYTITPYGCGTSCDYYCGAATTNPDC